MWTNIENPHEKWLIADNDLARKIIRLACLFCRQLPFIPDISKTETITLDGLKNYSIARVTDRENENELYGFYLSSKDAYDFYPLDKDGKSFELFQFILEKISAEDECDMIRSRIAEIQTRFSEYHSISQKGSLIFSDRTVAFLPFSGWDYLDPIDPKSKSHYSDIVKKIHAFTSVNDIELYQIWDCRLDFSEGYKLYELLARKKGKHFTRTYVLINWDDDKDVDGNIILREINGSSQVIHDIWEEEGSFRLDKSLEGTSVIAYLRFFCWAVEGDEGHFILPEKIYELPWTAPPSEEIKRSESLKFEIQELSESDIREKNYAEGYRYKIKANVAYGNAFFATWFGISDKGLIEMVDDEPLIADLSFKTEKFGSEYLPVFNEKAPTSELPLSADEEAVTEIRQPNIEELGERVRDIADEDKRGGDETAKVGDFEKQVDINGLAENLIVTYDLNITGLRVNKGAVSRIKEIIIRNCLFEEEVWLLKEAINDLPLRFERCVFKKGFFASETSQRNSLKFDDCDFGDFEGIFPFPNKPIINLHNLKIQGDLY